MIPGLARVALCCLWAPPGMSIVLSSASVTSGFDAVRGGFRGGGGGLVGWGVGLRWWGTLQFIYIQQAMEMISKIRCRQPHVQRDGDMDGHISSNETHWGTLVPSVGDKMHNSILKIPSFHTPASNFSKN